MNRILQLSFLCLLLSSVSWTLSAQETVQLSLDEAVDFAWQNSNEMKNAQINIIDAEERIKENRAVGIPKLNGTIDFQRYLLVPQQALPDAFVSFIETLNPGEPVDREVSFFLRNNFSAGLTLDALVFDGSYLTALKAAKVYRQYVAQDLQVKRREVRNRVIDAYLPALLLDKNLEILESNIQNLDQLFKETKALYEEGFAEQLDVDRLELSLANLQVDRENLARQKENAVNVLKFTLNADEDKNFKLTEDLESIAVQITEEDIAGEANYTARPELAYVQTGIELADLNIEQFKMGYYPTVRAFASFTEQYQSNTREDGFWAPTSLVGLSVNVPIFDGWDKRAKIQRAKLAKEINLNQQNDLVRSIKLEIDNARASYQTARESLNAQERNLNLARRIYETTQIKYREGVGSSIEVNQAEQSLYTSQANYTQALYNLTVAKFDLLKSLGK
ncbi:MAG: TolC family protein [Bacteroidota bacterium]